MKVGILGPRENTMSHSTKRLVEEAKKAFGNAKLIPIIETRLEAGKDLRVFHEKDDLSEYDYILPRIDSRRAEIAYPVMRLLDYLGVRKPYVAETVIIAHNKFITLEQLAKHGLPVPETYLTSSRETAQYIIDKVRLPAVIKLLSGFGGEGVLMVDSKEAFKSIIETMKILKQELLIEKYVPNPGEDIRGIMAGDEIIASFKRIAPEGEKKANIHMGGRSVSYKLTPEMREMVFRAGKAIKSRLCAVDMIVGKSGPKVIEVNINFGLRGIEKTTDINVARRVIEFIKNETRK